ncbi:hypothetical protein ACQPXM_33750 [Kribbella sp. CA-253562]|uniref:hypothetical protein n=1 Tax=Kribbella sp. CA-253562 TaxID=3239942 RepID=UPI003D9215F2
MRRRFESCRGHQRTHFRTSVIRKTAEVRCVGRHASLEVLSEQRGDRLAQHGPGDGDLVLHDLDEQLLEEELVGESPGLGSSETVELVAAPKQLERPVERVLDLGEDDLSGV